MTINLTKENYDELLDWMQRKGKIYAQKGDFDLWTIEGGIQLMQQRFTKDEGFCTIYTFKLPAPKTSDKIEYIEFYQEWAKWAMSMDAIREPISQSPIQLHK